MSEQVRLEWQDYLVFASLLAISGGIGVYYALSGGKQRTTKEFLLGNRRLNLIPVALSIYMSYISAITVLGTTAEMYHYGTQQLMQAFGTVFAYIIAALVFVPVIYPLGLVSVYQYFEMRYHSKLLRRLMSVIYIFQCIFLTGMVVYAPSTALEGVTGFPVSATVLCTLVVSTIYTSLGGIKAVVWADAFQALIFFGGMIAVLIVGSLKVGGMDKVWNISKETGRIEFFNMDFDPRTRMTFWNTCVGRLITSFATSGIGQTVIQRYSGLSTLSSAKRSLLLNIPLSLLMYTLVGLIGLVVYAYYTSQGCDPLRVGSISNSNQLLPYFIVDALGYPGFSGLLISVLFSGALSSISTTMSSVSAVVWQDFLEPVFKTQKETTKAMITKLIVVLFGFLSLGMSFLVAELPGHILQIANSLVGAITGCTSGALLLGLFFPCGNWIGAVAGLLFSLSLAMWMNVGQFLTGAGVAPQETAIHNCTLEGNATLVPPREDNMEGIFPLYTVSFMWFGVISNFTCIIVGLIVSLLTGGQDPEKVDSRLVVPFFDKFCCCLPLRVRKYLWCGIPHDQDVNDNKLKDNEDKNMKYLEIVMEIKRNDEPANVKDDMSKEENDQDNTAKETYTIRSEYCHTYDNDLIEPNGTVYPDNDGYLNTAYDSHYDSSGQTKL